LKLARFLHGFAGRLKPAAQEHPTQGPFSFGELVTAAFARGLAVAGAIDKVATARTAVSIEAAFMAISQITRDGACHPGAGAYGPFQKERHWKSFQS
jgi:hypothetical protein